MEDIDLTVSFRISGCVSLAFYRGETVDRYKMTKAIVDHMRNNQDWAEMLFDSIDIIEIGDGDNGDKVLTLNLGKEV